MHGPSPPQILGEDCPSSPPYVSDHGCRPNYMIFKTVVNDSAAQQGSLKIYGRDSQELSKVSTNIH